MRATGKLCDVTVRAGGEDFAAHRNVLACSSDYLDALFGSGMADSALDVVTLTDIPASVFSAVLTFIYDGTVAVEMSLLPAILEAAARLQVLSLQAAALAAAKAQLGADTALSLWTLGETLTLPELASDAKQAAMNHFEEIATSDALLGASHAQLAALLQDDKLVVSEEQTIFRAIVRWHEAAKPSEEEALALLRHVRFGLMPAAFLETTVSAWPLMASSLAYKDLVMKALISLATGGKPPAARKPPRIEWKVFDPNMIMSTGPDGETVFSRTESSLYDIALGPALTAGRHEWIVHSHAACNFVGVATSDCSQKSDPTQTTAWTVEVNDGMLCSGAADGTDGPTRMAASWEEEALELPEAAETYTTIRVLLDMDARTLSFARNDNPMQLAYTGLPDSVHPYLCSGLLHVVFKVLK